MYLFYVYVAKGGTPDPNDQIYTKVLCSYFEVSKYVEYLNVNSTDLKFYYFMRVSAYISTDGIKTL